LQEYAPLSALLAQSWALTIDRCTLVGGTWQQLTTIQSA
jgi:hypothetical protein